MNLNAAMELATCRKIAAGGSPNDRFNPVHAGAHSHFLKVGYMHTGNKNRGGIPTSQYFKTKNGNSRTVSVQADGSYVKMSRTAKGMRRTRGQYDGNGIKAHNMSPDMGSLKQHHRAEKRMRAEGDCDCGHAQWQHGKNGKCNVIGCEGKCGNNKIDAADAPKVNHLEQYQKLMKESAAHQRAADALTQSHQEEDRPLYEHHAGKAWRLGNQAMEHYKRMTKEQRAMLRDQHWQTARPQPQSFGKQGFQKQQFGK